MYFKFITTSADTPRRELSRQREHLKLLSPAYSTDYWHYAYWMVGYRHVVGAVSVCSVIPCRFFFFAVLISYFILSAHSHHPPQNLHLKLLVPSTRHHTSSHFNVFGSIGWGHFICHHALRSRSTRKGISYRPLSLPN